MALNERLHHQTIAGQNTARMNAVLFQLGGRPGCPAFQFSTERAAFRSHW